MNTLSAHETFIGYVSIPFGKKQDTDFADIYKRGILKILQSPPPRGCKHLSLFREDEPVPRLSPKHYRRLERLAWP